MIERPFRPHPKPAPRQKAGASPFDRPKPARVTQDPQEALHQADAVYTDVWVSMGMEAEKAERLKLMQPYQVNARLLALAKPSSRRLTTPSSLAWGDRAKLSAPCKTNFCSAPPMGMTSNKPKRP